MEEEKLNFTYNQNENSKVYNNNNMIEGVTERTKINVGLDIKGLKICGEIRLPGVDIKGKF